MSGNIEGGKSRKIESKRIAKEPQEKCAINHEFLIYFF